MWPQTCPGHEQAARCDSKPLSGKDLVGSSAYLDPALITEGTCNNSEETKHYKSPPFRWDLEITQTSHEESSCCPVVIPPCGEVTTCTQQGRDHYVTMGNHVGLADHVRSLGTGLGDHGGLNWASNQKVTQPDLHSRKVLLATKQRMEKMETDEGQRDQVGSHGSHMTTLSQD